MCTPPPHPSCVSHALLFPWFFLHRLRGTTAAPPHPFSRPECRTILQIKQLHMERSELEQQVDALKAKCEEIETKEAQRRAAEEEKHAEEVRKLFLLCWHFCVLCHLCLLSPLQFLDEPRPHSCVPRLRS